MFPNVFYNEQLIDHLNVEHFAGLVVEEKGPMTKNGKLRVPSQSYSLSFMIN